MPLIKCPECGHDVSSEAKFCPNCGYPIKEDKTNYDKKSNPISNDWTKKYYNRKTKLKTIGIIVGIILFILGVISSIGGFIAPFDFMFLPFLGFPMFGAGIMIIFSSITFTLATKIVVKEVDGYTILVKTCFQTIVVIDDQVIVEGTTNRYIDFNLPNGKKMYVQLGVNDRSIYIGEGENKPLF